jgi:hypothetical protein
MYGMALCDCIYALRKSCVMKGRKYLVEEYVGPSQPLGL